MVMGRRIKRIVSMDDNKPNFLRQKSVSGMCVSYIIHHTSYIIHHTSYIHTSYIIRHTSYIIHHTPYIIYIIHHPSYIIYTRTQAQQTVGQAEKGVKVLKKHKSNSHYTLVMGKRV